MSERVGNEIVAKVRRNDSLLSWGVEEKLMPSYDLHDDRTRRRTASKEVVASSVSLGFSPASDRVFLSLLADARPTASTMSAT